MSSENYLKKKNKIESKLPQHTHLSNGGGGDMQHRETLMYVLLGCIASCVTCVPYFISLSYILSYISLNL